MALDAYGFPTTPTTKIIGQNDAIIIEVDSDNSLPPLTIINSLYNTVFQITNDGRLRSIAGYFFTPSGADIEI